MNNSEEKNRGFTLFIAIVVMATLFLIATGITNLAVKQSLISNIGKESQHAFYAADTGLECALYWDVKNPSGQSAFYASSTSVIECNRDSSNESNNVWVTGGDSFGMRNIGPITFSPYPYCARVSITKWASGQTTIESRGYNTCDTSDPRRVERAVRATY